jgi:hypothetical protein
MSPRLLLRDGLRDSAGTRSERGVPGVAHLNSLALEALKYLLDEKERLFCRGAVWTKRGIVRDLPSRKVTTIVLLGLQRLARSGAAHGFDLATIQREVFADSSWIRSAGDLGLFLWFTALCAPEKFATALSGFDWDATLRTFADSRQEHTLGLAWLLTGIAHAWQVGAEIQTDLTDLAVSLYRILRDNQSATGLFGHAAARHGISGIVSSRFGTFADQMFAIYALVAFAQAFDIEEPLEPALNCANAVCGLQGPMGQWWSWYDKDRGCVVKRYPMHAVNQHGIAPLALSALEGTSRVSFLEPVRKGLAVVSAEDEWSLDSGKNENDVAWDRVELCGKIATCCKGLLEFAHLSRKPRQERLRLRCEMRPEHFGWLLYAFGDTGTMLGPSDRLAVTA